MSITDQLSPAGREFYNNYLHTYNLDPFSERGETIKKLLLSKDDVWARPLSEVAKETVLKEYQALTAHDKTLLLTSVWRYPITRSVCQLMTAPFREAHGSKIVSSDNPTWKIWAQLIGSTFPISWIFYLKDSKVSDEEKRPFVLGLMSELHYHLNQLKNRYGRDALIVKAYDSYASSVLDKVYSITTNDQNKNPIFDTDGDGVVDTLDDFPMESGYAKDSDHDAVPDELDPAKEDPKIWHSLKEGEVRTYSHLATVD